MIPWLREDIAKAKPSVIAFETHGGDSTLCMREGGALPRRDSVDYYRRYRRDMKAFVDTALATRARVIFIETPPEPNETGQREQDQLTSLARGLVGARFSVTETGRSALGGRVWARTMPCLASEGTPQGCERGRIVVRAPDKLHFCPRGYASEGSITAGCPEYSGGAVRFGRAIAVALVGS
jgi:hypothetical protein